MASTMPKMRVCVMPGPVQLKNLETGAGGDVATMRKVAWDLWLNDQRWQDPMPRLAYYGDVVREFDKKEGEKMRFLPEAWEVLCEILNKPGRNPDGSQRLYSPGAMFQLKPVFYAAILKAELEEV